MPKAVRGFHGHIAAMLDLNEYQLRLLFRLKRGDDLSGGNSGPVLDRKGLTRTVPNPRNAAWIDRRVLTERGLEICERARQLGY